MSFLAEASRIVAASPQAAFDRLADHASWKDWMPPGFRPVGPSVGVLRPGARLLVRIAGAPIATPIEVTVVEPGVEIAWRGGNGLLRGNHRFLFERAEADRTRVRSVETWDGLFAALAQPFVKPVAERVGREQLAGLARALGERD